MNRTPHYLKMYLKLVPRVLIFSRIDCQIIIQFENRDWTQYDFFCMLYDVPYSVFLLHQLLSNLKCDNQLATENPIGDLQVTLSNL
jgi:hypothetical protein